MKASSGGDTALHLTGQSGLPKYVQLRNALVDAISEGRWSPGDKLPSEQVLAELASVSLGTAQRALRLLVEEGRLVRRQGAGTFVAQAHAPMGGPFQHFRFCGDDDDTILPIYTRVVRRFKLPPGTPMAELLRTHRVICIDRVFSIGGEFSLYVQTYFDARRFPELATIEPPKLTGVSFKDLISRKYHQPAAHYDQRLEVLTFPEDVCKAIDVPVGTAGARLHLVARDRQKDAIYQQQIYIPPNSRQLMISP